MPVCEKSLVKHEPFLSLPPRRRLARSLVCGENVTYAFAYRDGLSSFDALSVRDGEQCEMRILIVEDEPDMARLIRQRLKNAGYTCDQVVNLESAIEALKQFPYELMLLDRRLPDGDGAAAVRRMRNLRPGVRIVMVTAVDAPHERVAGLDAGADDYLIKPFDGEELMARIRARLRPSGGGATPTIVVGALSFDPVALQFCVADRPITLRRREVALLGALIRRADCVVARATLMEEIYGLDDAVLPGALDTLVSRLRKRLESAAANIEIHLVRGLGYLLSEKNS